MSKVAQIGSTRDERMDAANAHSSYIKGADIILHGYVVSR